MWIQDFFLQLVVILFIARLFGEVAVRFNLPSVIGELIAGLIIGPSLFNLIHPTETIRLLAEIGIVLLLFEVGLETDIHRLMKTGSKPFIVALGGVVLPFVFGFFLSYSVFKLSLIVSLFIGSTLTATSIGITMRVLSELKKQATHEAQIVLGAAVIDDIIGIILLSILFEFANGGGVSILNVGKIILFVSAFLLIAPIAAKFIANFIQNYSKKSTIPGLLPATIVTLILFFAWLAHQVGAPPLIGGFAAGLALSKQFFLPLGPSFAVEQHFSEKVEKQMQPIVHLFTPIFFVTIGLSLNLKTIPWDSPFIWGLSLSLLMAALLGKVLSGFLLIKEKQMVRWAIGIAMIPRGEVGLIFAEIGKSSGAFNNDLYAAMIIVIAVTTILAPFMLRFFYSHRLD